jgi:hypothetical protein
MEQRLMEILAQLPQEVIVEAAAVAVRMLGISKIVEAALVVVA